MNAVIKRVWRQDKMVNVDVLNGFVFTGEANAHQFVISGKNGDEPVDIIGSITANFKNAGGVLVPLTGSIVDGEAVITLTPDCYAVEGPFTLTIFADTLCIYAAIANVINSSGEVIAYPTASIPSIQELIEEAQDVIASIPQDYSTLNQSVTDLKSAITNAEDDIEALETALPGKVSKPVSSPNGTNGQLLRTNGDGTTTWVDQGLPTDAQTATAVNAWLNAHPEATTTVQDNSLTYKKLVNGTLGYVMPEMFDAIGDGQTDDTTAFSQAFNASDTIVLSNKTYYVPDFVVPTGKTIIGVNNGNASNCIIKTNGIVLNSRTVLSHVCVVPASVPRSGITLSGSYIRVNNCHVSGAFNNGFYFDDSKYTGNIIIHGCVVYGCVYNGLYIKSYTEQTIVNNVEITGCYFSTNGTNANNYTAESTKKASGHGIQIDGGRSIAVRDCVVEYSSGIGIFLRALSMDISGIVISTPYFEHNKYSNLYVENQYTSKAFDNVHIEGDFYSDGGVGLPSDALANRGLVVVNNTNLLFKKDLSPSTNSFSAVSNKARFTAHPINNRNIFPYDLVKDIISEYETIVDEDGEKALRYNQATYDYAMTIPIIGGVTYSLSCNAKLSGDGSAYFGLAVSPISGGTIQYKLMTLNGTTWANKTLTFSVSEDSTAQLYIESVNANRIAFVKDIIVEPS